MHNNCKTTLTIYGKKYIIKQYYVTEAFMILKERNCYLIKYLLSISSSFKPEN